ncbi:zinc finger domain-containing protein [Nocardioides sp. Root614]|uniref:zinc finger domain-containing protein n=1 Tax=Nocardioides sp. Root614 TaxID=1736571 RepID=UPI0006FABEE1|nr:hypothetical protein ASD81_20020 [Nocardioides sp. Root614]KRA86903.1 hypothetical protein ASD84_22235 [Nocardioides sp. Root682]
MKLTWCLDAHSVICPTCGALPMRHCRELSGNLREVTHLDRYRAFTHQRAISEGRAPGRSPGEREEHRAQIRTVDCPTCHVAAHEWCQWRSPRGRRAVHPARTEAYETATTSSTRHPVVSTK